jgi:pimeloyl-ACP methyl ester carboxylesterase
MINQIYVEKLTPINAIQPYPIVFIHGQSQTATNFLSTPDGREGWATFFLSRGYTIYLSDQPSRGRSPWNPSIGQMSASSAIQVEQLFTAPESYGLWKQSYLHSQWPGTGRIGDPVFDAFYASQVQSQADARISEAQNAKAYTALLDKIGVAHIITHSQAGPYGWRIGDLRRHLVRSIIALEPGGPPFITRVPVLPLLPARPWGITELEVHYEPSAGPNATGLETVIVPAKDEDHAYCIMQEEPAKKLTYLAQVPVLVVTAEASYHAPYDYCTVNYLRQAGVEVEHLELGKEGIHGNGHMFFMEKNSLDIAEKVLGWLQKNWTSAEHSR